MEFFIVLEKSIFLTEVIMKEWFITMFYKVLEYYFTNKIGNMVFFKMIHAKN